MKIDKAAFLLLTGAIAAGACVIESTDDGDGGGGAGGTTTAQGGTTNPGGSGGTTNTGGSGGDEGGNGGSGGAPCDDSVGNPGDCSGAATSCAEGFDIALCDGAKTAFKPKVAENAVTCILALAGAASCDDVLDCRNDALAAACADDTANDLCADLVKTCTDAGNTIDAAGCHALVDGLNGDGRTLLADTCGSQSEGLCYEGLPACIDNLW